MHKVTFLITIFLFQCGWITKNNEHLNQDLKLALLLDSLNIERERLTISIDKSDYKLSVLSENKVIKEYPVVFGGNPNDDKLMQGDQCTPEGAFKVRDHYPHSSWSKFIWVDYPNKASWQKHKSAKEKGTIPDGAEIGGEIGIHGVPKGYDYAIKSKMNWTLGCISMTNEDINEIYPYVFKGMSISIVK